MSGNKSDQAGCAGGGAVYGLGFIGAIIYFFVAAETFWDYVLAIPKGIVWPAIRGYEVLKIVYG